jgi:hypothetical protein
LSLQQLARDFVDKQLDGLVAKLDLLKVDSLFDPINALISSYNNFLLTKTFTFTILGVTYESYTIGQVLDLLDDFKECASGSCDFIETAINAQDDLAKKLNISKATGEWKSTSSNIIAVEKAKLGIAVNAKKAELQAAIARRKEGNTQDVVSKDSTMSV